MLQFSRCPHPSGSPSFDDPKLFSEYRARHDAAYSYDCSGYLEGDTVSTSSTHKNEKFGRFYRPPSGRFTAWIGPADVEHMSPCADSSQLFDGWPYGSPVTTVMFVAATVVAVPITQYRPTHRQNNGEPFFNKTHSQSNAASTHPYDWELDHETGTAPWSSVAYRAATNPSADAFSMSTLVFCAVLTLLCHSNRRSLSQKPFLIAGVGVALTLTGYCRGRDGIPWNKTVPVAVITALVLSRIMDTIYNRMWTPASVVDE